MKIVRPVPVDIRTAWPREDLDLTPWLADNLDFLHEIGLGELELIDTEVEIPRVRRRLDILATTIDDRKVAIENQYRSVDHDHLTRGLAYAVALDAAALVVIAEKHGDEFIAVAEYLNAASEALGAEGLAVFLVALEVDKVGSFLVPRFDVVARPNTWRAEVRQHSAGRPRGDAELARRDSRRQFWTEALQVAANAGFELFSNATARTGAFVSVTAVSGFNITWNLQVRTHDCYPLLWIDTGDASINSEILFALRDRVAADDLDFDVEWSAKDNARSCSVSGSPIADCGWKTPAAERAAGIAELVKRARDFVAAIEPGLAATVAGVVESTDR